MMFFWFFMWGFKDYMLTQESYQMKISVLRSFKGFKSDDPLYASTMSETANFLLSLEDKLIDENNSLFKFS